MLVVAVVMVVIILNVLGSRKSCWSLLQQSCYCREKEKLGWDCSLQAAHLIEWSEDEEVEDEVVGRSEWEWPVAMSHCRTAFLESLPVFGCI